MKLVLSSSVAAFVLATGVYFTGGTTVLDGDTFDYGRERIRILNIDTAELEARCSAELALALKAKARLIDLLDDGPMEIHRIARKDRYGRTLATVKVAGRDVGEVLISEGLARRWDGRRHPWC